MASVRIERLGPVQVVTIDRPQVRNAVDEDTSRKLREAFGRADDDESVLVSVLTGAGGSFCSGADLRALGGLAELVDGEAGPLGPTLMQTAKPVIAAIEGHAVAGGLELAIWCDLRVAAEDAVLGVYSRRFGVPLVDGGTVRLPRMIGHGRAMDLLLTGRGVGAYEALAMGLVDRVVPSGEALRSAIELAKALAAHPQAGLRNDRRSAIEQWGLETAEALANEARLGRETIESGEPFQGAERFEAGAGRHGERVDRA